jgi:hypothetical protein
VAQLQARTRRPNLHVGDLGERVHAGIGPTATHHRDSLLKNPSEDPFKCPLNRRPPSLLSAVCCLLSGTLDLPSGIARAVVGDRELEGPDTASLEAGPPRSGRGGWRLEATAFAYSLEPRAFSPVG